jgi:hypothetical protein
LSNDFPRSGTVWLMGANSCASILFTQSFVPLEDVHFLEVIRR